MIKNRYFKSTMGIFAEIAITGTTNSATASTTTANLELFEANAPVNSIWAFYEDGVKHPALAAGDTLLAANQKRSFFYAWKDPNGITKKSTSIPIAGLSYSSIAYSAGTQQVSTATFGGTYAPTQVLQVRIIDTTGTNLPYPSYEYSAVIDAGGINTAVALIATRINAEKYGPVVTATAATNVLTLTGNLKSTSFKIASYVELTTSQNVDNTAVVFAVVTKAVAPVGDIASVQELYRYYLINSGAVEYGNGNQTNGLDFGQPAQNITGTAQYGFVVVTSNRTEKGDVKDFPKKAYIVIALATGGQATLAAL